MNTATISPGSCWRYAGAPGQNQTDGVGGLHRVIDSSGGEVTTTTYLDNPEGTAWSFNGTREEFRELFRPA